MIEVGKDSYDDVGGGLQFLDTVETLSPGQSYQQPQTGTTGTTATQFQLPLGTFQTDQISKAGQGLVARQPVLTTATALGSVGYFQTNNLVVSGFSNWFWNNNN
jgi:hypothetical protein